MTTQLQRIDELAALIGAARRAGRPLLASENRRVHKIARGYVEDWRRSGAEMGATLMPEDTTIAVEQLADEVRQRLDGIDQRVNTRLGIEGPGVLSEPDDATFERKLKHGRDNTPAARRPIVLSRDESVAEWMRGRGQIRDEDSGLSFDRYIRGLATGNWDGAERELARYKLAMSEGTQTAGGHLVPTPLAGRIIDLARNAMRVMQAGATTVPMTSQTLKMARLTGEGTPAWHAENAAITDADLAFDAVTFTARTLTRLVKVSMELFEDADPSSEDIIARSFAAQIALELDRVALRGSGTPPEPRGVLNSTGVTLTDHGANGAAISNYDFHLDAVGTVRNLNFEPTAHIQAPRTSTSLSKLKEATTNAYLAPPAGLLPMLPTKQVPINLTVGTSNDCSEIYTGQWNQLMIGMRTAFQLRFLSERYIDSGQYAFLAYLRADVQLAHGEAFVVDRGVRG